MEFALVFPVLFLMLYGMCTYALVMAVQHSLTQAAAEGGRAALRFQSGNDAVVLRQNAACAMAQQGIAWLVQLSGQSAQCQAGGNLQVVTKEQVCPVAAQGPNLKCISVVVSYNYGAVPLMPKLPLLPVPGVLTGEARTQIAVKS